MMHNLSREIRFFVNPFLARDSRGFNSYCGKPSGEGLGIYFSLWVELAGKVDEGTGFVVNVSDIDAVVRGKVLPVFGEFVRGRYRGQKHIGIFELGELLRKSWGILKGSFGDRELCSLVLGLSPCRKIRIDSEDSNVIEYSEKFEFAAMHKLWNDEFSDEENFRAFGKCANRAGHGHNYVIEVTVRGDGKVGVGEFERKVEDGFLSVVDHKNLNADVAEFSGLNPTVENISSFAWERLSGVFGAGELLKVTVWENDRTCCSFSG